MDEFEVIVVGGGPAGLSAALYLARYDRQVALFDAGQGRSTWHQTAHNYLGFPGGVKTQHLRELGYQQLSEYEQVTVFHNKVEEVRRDEDGGFTASGQAGQWRGRAVILCTGVVDHYPHFDGWNEYVGRSLFWCITCDGYACKGQTVLAVGNTNETASVAMQLSRFTDKITLLTNSEDYEISPVFEARLQAQEIPIIRGKIDSAEGTDGMFRAVILKDGRRLELDQMFSHQGATPQNDLAKQLGALLDSNGYILTDTEQKTNVPGVYAAGDVTRLFAHQVSTAVHEGGMAASAANYYLYPPELKDE